jgi:hypothetical protein
MRYTSRESSSTSTELRNSSFLLLQEGSRQNYLSALIAWAFTAGHREEVFPEAVYEGIFLHWLGQPRRLRLIPARTITRSHLYFKCRGGWAIFFSRFLFSALGGVMNPLAGADRYPYRHFLLYDLPGEALGAVITPS